MGNITVWDTFFMMLTVIPVSKMFNMIFMKMLVRVGTVNQEKWSAIGLGALGATYSLMKNGGVPGITGNMARMQVKPGPPSTPGLGGPSGAAPNIPGAGPGGGAGSSGANSYSGNVASDVSGYGETPSSGTTHGLMKKGGLSGITSNMAGMQVKSGLPNTPGLGSSSGASSNIPGAGPGGGAGSSGANSYSGNVASDISGYRETPSGFFIPSGVYDDAGYGNENTSSGTEEGAAGVSASGNVYGAGAGGPGAVPERGSRRLEDIVNIASQAGHKFSKGAAFAGVLSSFAVPEAAPAMAGVYGVAGKASAGLASTAYHVSQEIRERKNNGQDFWGAMKDLTGTTNRVAATTKVAATMALSPMGRRVSNFGTQTSVNAYLWTKGRFGKN